MKMKKFNFKIIALPILLILTVCIITIFTGCGKAEISDISVSKSDPPRLEYVVGQELDLTRGSITVKEGKKEKNVALSDTGVTISGYDGNVIGKQTLTVEYSGKSTSYEITVIERITVSEFKEVYFVGDELDLSVGKVKIANDDATTFPLNFDDARLTFNGFSSEEIGSKTVTVKYSDGGKSYEVSFTVNVYSNETQDFIDGIKDLLSVIPSDWTSSTLGKYKAEIEESVNLIFILKENKTFDNLREILKTLIDSREKKDCFDIIYSYYCYTATDGHSFIANSLWQTVPMPSSLEAWYGSLCKAAKEAAFMAQNEKGSAFLYDTSDFMLYYFETLGATDAIKKSDSLEKDIYGIINGDLVFESNLRRADVGYLTLTDGMLGYGLYESLWENYLELVPSYKNGALNNGTNADKIEELFELYTALSPAELHGFLSSLNFLYGESDTDALLSDSENGYGNCFFAILGGYFESKLSSDAKTVYKQLLMAMESYAASCASNKASATESFKTLITSAEATYGSLSGEEREAFDSLVGAAYEKYLLIYGALTDENEPSYNEIGEDAENLKATLKKYFNVLSLISDETRPSEEKTPLYALLFSLYERANGIYEKIKLTDNKEDLATLSAKLYNISAASLTLDAAFYISRDVFVSYLTATVIEGENSASNQILWDAYTATKLSSFLKDASYILEYKHFGTQLDKAVADSVTAAFRELSAGDRKIFYMIGCTLYYDALEAYYHEIFADDESAKKFATSVFEAEYAYVNYVQNTSNTAALESFKTKMKTAISSYLAINNRSMRNSYFSAIYEYYKEIYNSFN